MTYCLTDAKEQGRSGVCMLGARKQKAWLSDQAFAKRFGFAAVDVTNDGYELLALSFDGTVPRFTQGAKEAVIAAQELTVYYDAQCPFVLQSIEGIRAYCEERGVPASFRLVDTLQKAKDMPCVFNNWAVFYKGKFETVNLLPDVAGVARILKK